MYVSKWPSLKTANSCAHTYAQPQTKASCLGHQLAPPPPQDSNPCSSLHAASPDGDGCRGRPLGDKVVGDCHEHRLQHVVWHQRVGRLREERQHTRHICRPHIRSAHRQQGRREGRGEDGGRGRESGKKGKGKRGDEGRVQCV